MHSFSFKAEHFNSNLKLWYINIYIYIKHKIKFIISLTPEEAFYYYISYIHVKLTWKKVKLFFFFQILFLTCGYNRNFDSMPLKNFSIFLTLISEGNNFRQKSGVSNK